MKKRTSLLIAAVGGVALLTIALFQVHSIFEQRADVIKVATRHLSNLKDKNAAYVFQSEEDSMRLALERGGLNLADLDLTEKDIEKLRVDAYRTTAVAQLEIIRNQPLYAVTYVAPNTEYYLKYVGESAEEQTELKAELATLKECGFQILANRIMTFEQKKNDETYGPLIDDYEELKSYLEHKNYRQLSKQAGIKLMDLVEYGLKTDPPCAPYI